MKLIMDSDLTNKENLIECEDCGSIVEVNKEDWQIGGYGLEYFECPKCHKRQYHSMGIDIDENNIEYPKHFDTNDGYLETEENATNEEITELCRKAIKEFKETKHIVKMYLKNTVVTVFDNVEEQAYEVVVARKPYHTYVPYKN